MQPSKCYWRKVRKRPPQANAKPFLRGKLVQRVYYEYTATTIRINRPPVQVAADASHPRALHQDYTVDVKRRQSNTKLGSFSIQTFSVSSHLICAAVHRTWTSERSQQVADRSGRSGPMTWLTLFVSRRRRRSNLSCSTSDSKIKSISR